MPQLFTNNASSLLVEDVLSTDTTVNLGPGEGDQFPLADPGDATSFAILTLEDVNANFEIVKLTGRSGDILTIERGQESTTPIGFSIGDRIEARLTAGSLGQFTQAGDKYDLSGALTETDGIEVWHDSDRATYQKYELKFYDSDIYGEPTIAFIPPGGITGLNFAFGIIAPDATAKYVRLTTDTAGDMSFPGTGEVFLEVPGVAAWAELENPLDGNVMFAMWGAANAGEGQRLKFDAAGTEEVSYSFVTRDSEGVDGSILFASNREIYGSYALHLNNTDKVTYPTAHAMLVKPRAYPYAPADTDELVFQRDGWNTASRKNRYAFYTKYQDESAAWQEGSVLITEYGNVYADAEPTDNPHLTNKEYVDTAIADALSGSSVDLLAAAVYGRTVLWNNDGGSASSASETLLNSKNFSDFYQIEFTGKVDDSPDFYGSITIDSETMLDKGFTDRWAVHTAGSGDANKYLYVQPLSETTFAIGSESGGGLYKLVRVVGKFPKATGVVSTAPTPQQRGYGVAPAMDDADLPDSSM